MMILENALLILIAALILAIILAGLGRGGATVTLYNQHGRKQVKQFNYLAELVDPRPQDGHRFQYQGIVFLPVSYDCDWMTSNEDLQRAVTREIWNFANQI